MSEVATAAVGLPREEFVRLLRALSLPFAACLLFFFITPTPTTPFRRSTTEVRQQVISVVESQFTAFRDGDYARAYSHAAAGIQQQLSLGAFERMVKDGFPVIAYWRTVSFGEMKDNGQVAVLLVAVQGRRGQARFFRYELTREMDTWRISSVIEVRVSPAVQGQIA